LDSDTIETHTQRFIAQAGKRLRGLSTQSRDAILAEALSHIADRAAELEAAGMDAKQAETTAVAAFGNPERWAREIIDAAYADAYTETARILAVVAAAMSIALPLEMFIQSRVLQIYTVPIVVLPLLGVIAGSFRARRYAVGTLVVLGLLSAAIGFAGVGSTWVTDPDRSAAPRSVFQKWAKEADAVAIGSQRELDLLRLGIKTFGSTKSLALAPAALRVGSRYIVPQPVRGLTGGPYCYCGAFKRVPARYQKLITVTTSPLNAPAPYLTVGTIEEAQQAWRRDGPSWFKSRERSASDQRAEAARLRGLANRSDFDLYQGLSQMCMTAYWTTVVIMFHLAAAFAGRKLHSRRQANLVA
jgi:hypothetical protein